jgi:hypothetical protein
MKSTTLFSLVKPLAVVAVAASATLVGEPAQAFVGGPSTSFPESATLALFAVGLGALAFALGRRRNTARRAFAAAARVRAHPTA